MKQCPCCGSSKVKEYKVNGVWAITCHSCGYDSAEKADRYYTHNQAERDKKRREAR